jgi:hypothetical protein
MDECAQLRELNRETFQAEQRGKDGKIQDKTWDEFLREALADDFILRRSNPARNDETRAQMIDAIAASTPVERQVIEEEVRAWCTDTLGAIVCPVEMVRDGAVHRYQNIKVFTRTPPGAWRCVHWQVTEAPVRNR